MFGVADPIPIPLTAVTLGEAYAIVSLETVASFLVAALLMIALFNFGTRSWRLTLFLLVGLITLLLATLFLWLFFDRMAMALLVLFVTVVFLLTGWHYWSHQLSERRVPAEVIERVIAVWAGAGFSFLAVSQGPSLAWAFGRITFYENAVILAIILACSLILVSFWYFRRLLAHNYLREDRDAAGS